MPKQPNIVFVFADQWRGQAVGYAGDPNARTPNIDALAAKSLNFTNATSGCPVCCPYRASLITGQYPLTHGVFINDAPLGNNATSIADAFKASGYNTAYIGKWHIDGHGRLSFTPPERRQGFDYWKVVECTHDYNNSIYYADEDKKELWDGYDALAQTRDAQKYINEYDSESPFMLFLSWGPPHEPYQTAPEQFRKNYSPEKVTLRPNVPQEAEANAREDLAGYYAHIEALDNCMEMLLGTIKEKGIEEDTIFIFTSDHGDMLGSHGSYKKQQPQEESISVPFLLRYPAMFGRGGKVVDDVLIDAPDIMPTLLGLSDIAIPDTVEGTDFSGYLNGGQNPSDSAALLTCPSPFGQWQRSKGGREYRGVRTTTHTYVRSLQGPWLLYDNINDPYQTDNLINKPEHAELQKQLEEKLQQKLSENGDKFLSGQEYIDKWGYVTDETGTLPTRP